MPRKKNWLTDMFMVPVDTIITKNFDFIVLGSGPAGQRAAIQAAKAGKTVAVVENGKAGGGSVHVGTIPSKTLKEATLRPDATWNKSLLQAASVVSREAKIIRAQLKRNGVSFFTGSGYFLNSKIIGLRGKNIRLSSDKILIATGARPLHLPEFPFSWPGVYDSDTILKMKKPPKSMLILGAGVIGCEYASLFARLGISVVVADRRKELLRSVDEELTSILRRELGTHKVIFHLAVPVGEFKKAPGSAKLLVKVGKKNLKLDAVLICMGRTPNTDSLDLGAAGILTDPRGYLTVTTNYETNVPGIYAAGDVIGAPALAATSSEQGRIAACHAFGLLSEAFPELFPMGIYTTPEISSVGLSEEELKQRKIPYVVGKSKYSELARGQILGDESGLLKILVHRDTHELLGTHIIGTGASELVHLGLILQSLRVKVEFLRQSIFNYPTLAEAYKVAALNALNQLGTVVVTKS